ncbi:MAG: TnpV protein [Firmicutes bacterium]|nr:TnpV protein [Bacillota bacterium]
MAPEHAITYTEVNGYFIPDLALPEQPEGDIGKYGRAQLAYLREHKSVLHMHMMTQGTLWEHLLEIQRTATERMELLTAQMMAAQGVTEDLKSRNQLLWVGKVSNIRACAEEIIREELINT